MQIDPLCVLYRIDLLYWIYLEILQIETQTATRADCCANLVIYEIEMLQMLKFIQVLKKPS